VVKMKMGVREVVRESISVGRRRLRIQRVAKEIVARVMESVMVRRNMRDRGWWGGVSCEF
jgi:hypothetical protein